MFHETQSSPMPAHKRPAPPKKKRPTRQPTARTSTDLAAALRAARIDRGLSQKELAAKAKLRPAQVSVVEGGFNVQSAHYARIAKVLGFRSTLELFRAHDPQTTTLLRLWDAMDPRIRETALKKLTVWLLED